MSDADFINEKWNKIIDRLRDDFNKWEKHTLKQYIIDCAEIVELKIDHGLLDIEKQEISSYLNKEFIKQELVIPDRTIRDALPPIYKRNYSESDLRAELNKSKWITKLDTDGYLLEEDQHGNKRINGIEVREVKKPKNIEIDFDSSVQKPKEEINDEYTKLLRVMGKCGNLVERFSEALEDEYNNDKESRIIIQKNLFNIKKELENYLNIHATLTLARNELDKREKWGDYEKTMFQFLLEVCDTKAHLAEKVGYCSKYASTGIERNPELEKYTEFARKCPSCKKDIAHLKNLEIQKYKSGKELSIDLPDNAY